MPWLVQTWVAGQTATPTELGASSEFALDLARLVRALREVDLKGRAFDGRGRGGNLREHDGWLEICFAKSEGLLDVALLRDMWEEFRTLPHEKSDVMSHKDLIPGNLLVQGGRLTGVIDTGAFGPADRSLDLVVGWHLLDLKCRNIFREALQAEDLEWKRGAAWAFQQAMGLIWYYRVTNPSMANLGLNTVSRLIEDCNELR